MSQTLRLLVAYSLVILSLDFHFGQALDDKQITPKPYVYYEVPFEDFWINLDDWEANNGDNVTVHHVKRSRFLWYNVDTRVRLSFRFPFYDKVIKDDIIITRNDGAISFGWDLTSSITALNVSELDPKPPGFFSVRYADNGTCFIVEWNDIFFQKHKPQGPFRFELILKDTGDIIFAYKTLPFMIPSREFPGIQIQLRTENVKQQLDLMENNRLTIVSSTAVYIKARQLCQWQSSCKSCLDLSEFADQECVWCMNGYCYEGSDKKRDYWASHLLEQCYHRNMFVNGSASICKKEKRGLFSYPSKIPPAEANAFEQLWKNYYHFKALDSTSWIDLDKWIQDKSGLVIDKPILVASAWKMDRFLTYYPSFKFPFMGKPLFYNNDIQISGRGFLQVQDVFDEYNYIAPLMTDFFPREDETSLVRVGDNGTCLVVEWNNLFLAANKSKQPFSFQAIILDNGDITFAYKDSNSILYKANKVKHGPEDIENPLKKDDDWYYDFFPPEAYIKAEIEDLFGGQKPEHDYTWYHEKSQVPFDESWVDLSSWKSIVVPVRSMENISIELNYPFLYYGFYMRNIIVSTRAGFIYMEGQGKDSVLAPLQYVAPLMGMFVESPNDLAFVQFGFNGTAVVVEWNNMILKDNGPCTFQAILHKSGDIVFAYKTLTFKVKSSSETVDSIINVGISNAKLVDDVLFYQEKSSIFEPAKLTNSSAFRFKPWSICSMQTSCRDCMGHRHNGNDGTTTLCNWCPSANLCSTNEDLNKIKWKKSNCSQPGNCFDGFDLAKFGLDHCDVYDKKTTETPRIYEPETPPSRLELNKPPEVIKEEVEHRDTPIVFLAIVILAGLAFHLIICGCLIKACKDRKTTSGHLSKNLKLEINSISKLVDKVGDKRIV